MSRIREKAFWCDFVRLYKARPVLWSVKSEIYKKRNLKRHAYQELAYKLRRLFPDADVEMVKRKINSIRACYRREAAKIRDNREAMANDEKVEEYKPTWWLFPQLKFLSSQEHDQNSTKTEELMDEQEVLNAAEEDEEQEEEDERFVSDIQSLSSCNEEELELDEPQSSSLQRIDFLDVTSTNQHPRTEQQHQQKHRKQQQHQQQYQQADDDAQIYGRCWAIQYKELNADQKIYAKKAIEDIFFEAKLGTLQRNSVKINENEKMEQRSLRIYND